MLLRARGRLRDLGAADDAARDLTIGSGLDTFMRESTPGVSRATSICSGGCGAASWSTWSVVWCDPEALLEQPLELAAQLVAVVAGAHDDVRRQRREARGDLPDVQVVDLDDARLGGEHVADLVRVQPAGAASMNTRPDAFSRP